MCGHDSRKTANDMGILLSGEEEGGGFLFTIASNGTDLLERHFFINVFFMNNTEGKLKVCTWLREISSCSCLTVLPGPAWVLLSKTYKPFFAPL